MRKIKEIQIRSVLLGTSILALTLVFFLFALILPYWLFLLSFFLVSYAIVHRTMGIVRSFRAVDVSHRTTFVLTIILVGVIWTIVAANYYLLPEVSHFSSIAVTAGLVAFFVVAAWGLITRTRSLNWLAVVLLVCIGFGLIFVRLGPGPTEQRQEYEQLHALGYIEWVPVGDSEESGVVHCDTELVQPGLNLYNADRASTAHLIDIDGKPIKTWSFGEPSFGEPDLHHVELCRNGDLLGIIQDRGITRLESNSKVVWSLPGAFHHDIVEAEDGTILALLRGNEILFSDLTPLPILNDYIVTMSADGIVRDKISVYELLQEEEEFSYDRMKQLAIRSCAISEWSPKGILRHGASFLFKLINRGWGCSYDAFHTNSIEILDQNIEGVCAPGDVLISVREMNLIVVVSLPARKVVWSWGSDQLEGQHHASLLSNGNILVFDNGRIRGFSRIIELDPKSEEIVWEYRASPPSSFYSDVRGGCQRLQNGNTLVTDSNSGQAFEISAGGRVVWRFVNPEMNENETTRKNIYRMTRLATGRGAALR